MSIYNILLIGVFISVYLCVYICVCLSMYVLWQTAGRVRGIVPEMR